MPIEFRDLKAGDQFEPIHINQIYRFLRKLIKLKVVFPLRLDSWGSADAIPTLSIIGADNFYVAETTTAITARSGSTLGTGTVKLQQEDGSGGLIDIPGANTVDVFNVSSATMTSGNGIDSGMKVWVRKDLYGNWWVMPTECS